MVLPTGESPISFSGIRTEFGTAGAESSTAPVRLGQYRRDDSAFTNKDVGGLLNQPLDEGIPTSGAINVDAFHNKRLNVIIDYHSGATENRPVVAKSKYAESSTSEGNSTGNWNVIGGYRNPPALTGGTKTRIHVNKEIGSSNTNTNNCAVRTGTGWNAGTVLTVEIGSSGALYGAGGNGGDGGSGDGQGSGSGNRDGADGSAGSSALGIQYSGTTIINDGSIINGYGGGGGGGYRKVEREEWFSGPVYAAGGGGGGAGQGLPAGTAGSGTGGGGTFYEEVSGSPFYVTTSGSESQVLQTMGIIATVDTVSANDSTRTAGTYNVTTYNAQGSGTGATFSIVIANDANKTVTVNITTGGSGYVVNNTITVAAAQIGGTGPALTFDVASISSLFTFKKGGSTVGSNTNGEAVIVGGGGVGTKRYVLFAENDDATSVETANPVVDNSPSNRIFRITEYEIISGGSSAGGGGTGSKTAGGNGGNGGESNQAHGGGGGGGGSNGTGGEGGMTSGENDGANGTASSGGAGEKGRHTGGIESENNIQGQGGSGGASGAAIRRTSGITVNITNNGTIDGSTTATGVS